MIDASAFVEYLLQTPFGLQVATIVEDPLSELHAPALCDVEVCAALRRAAADERMPRGATLERLDAYLDLPVWRHNHQALLRRILELQENFTAYDAIYVSLCEALSATLVTGDGGLTRAVRQTLPLNVIGVS